MWRAVSILTRIRAEQSGPRDVRAGRRELPPQPSEAIRPGGRRDDWERGRLPVRMLRSLGAECPLCQGLGCVDCAGSGLG